MLRHFLRRGVGMAFSTEDDGKSPRVSMADNLAEVLFSKQPSRCNPTLDHVRMAPARHVMGSLLHAALRALNDVGGSKAFYSEGGSCSR